MKKISVLAGLLVGGLLAGPALALDLAQGQKVTLGPEQVIAGDWYAAGKSIDLAGRVNRSAFLAARRVEAFGKVDQDLNAAAETVRTGGAIKGSLRAVAREITVSATVAGDALLAGRDVTLEPGSLVGEDLYAAAGRIALDGLVKGRVRLIAGEVYLNGPLGKEVEVRAEHLTLGPQARLAGSLTYFSPQALTLSQGAQTPAGVQWHKTTPWGEKKRLLGLPLALGGLLLLRLGAALAWLVLGILLVLLLPAASRQFAQTIRERPWASLGLGAATLFGAPLVAILLVFTWLGIPLGLLLVVALVLGIVLARIAAAYWIGILIYGEGSRAQPISAFIVGWVIFAVLTFIPVLGFLVKLAGTMLGLGVWWLLPATAAKAGRRPAARTAKP